MRSLTMQVGVGDEPRLHPLEPLVLLRQKNAGDGNGVARRRNPGDFAVAVNAHAAPSERRRENELSGIKFSLNSSGCGWL